MIYNVVTELSYNFRCGEVDRQAVIPTAVTILIIRNWTVELWEDKADKDPLIRETLMEMLLLILMQCAMDNYIIVKVPERERRKVQELR